jgi:hypothetical protein
LRIEEQDLSEWVEAVCRIEKNQRRSYNRAIR